MVGKVKCYLDQDLNKILIFINLGKFFSVFHGCENSYLTMRPLGRIITNKR